MNFTNLLVETRDRILYITINRESKLNALNKVTLAELHHAITNSFHDNTIGGLIITGAGQKAFVAGADISEFADFNTDEGRELAREGQSKVFDVIQNSEKPIIAAINGFALGGGLELAMACHIRVAATTAKMGLPEVSLGLIPGYGGTQRLSQLVGRGRALEMILTADMVSAAEAHRTGLVNHVTEPDMIMAKSEEILKKIISRSPYAVGCAIRAVNAAFIEGQNGYESEIAEFSNCFGSEDFKEGVAAFLEKRKAEFTGK
ncbi:enoyl-CoA hydratase [Daejeonella rubra]|uniref:Enoyl-CoA hydratase n=1 Tax=Daejeonella rubra TaxID=990371 RepID=A0A1G9RI43_9SPHI|nr:enoyl-CoA hydratase-related protein [Daejeonella rubra]SDM22863.1 enoyl-CoA hydratase [Daejeonella rubra]